MSMTMWKSYEGYADIFWLQCPCGDDCGTFIGRKDYQLGYERIALEQHEFWTHDYTGEMDVVTGTVEFA